MFKTARAAGPFVNQIGMAGGAVERAGDGRGERFTRRGDQYGLAVEIKASWCGRGSKCGRTLHRDRSEMGCSAGAIGNDVQHGAAGIAWGYLQLTVFHEVERPWSRQSRQGHDCD